MSNLDNAQNPSKWLVMLYVAADDVPDEFAPGEGGCFEEFDPIGNTSMLNKECVKMLDRLAQADISEKVTVVVLYDDNIRSESQGKSYEPSVLVLNLTKKEWQSKSDSIQREEGVFFTGENGKQEISTGHYLILGKFIRWAIKTYPSEKIMLSIIGHGGGWAPTLLFIDQFGNKIPADHEYILENWNSTSEKPLERGIVTDKAPNSSPGLNGICVDYSSCTAISTQQLRLAFEHGLGKQQSQNSQRKLDVVFLDSCLMGMVEVAYEIRECVDYLVAGENLLMAVLPYENYLDKKHLTEDTTPKQLAISVVDLYNANEQKKLWTIAAIKTSFTEKLRGYINDLSSALDKALDRKPELVRGKIKGAYYVSQKFDYNADMFINKPKEGYVDLFSLSFYLYKQMEDISSGGDNTFEKLINYASNQLVNIICLISSGRKSDVLRRWPKVGEILGDRKEEEPIIVAHKSADDDDNFDLREAEGLSIYFPFGEREDRNRNETIRKLLNYRSYLDHYVDQLRFTEMPASSSSTVRRYTPWARLLLRLDDLEPTFLPGWITEKGIYKTPRQLAVPSSSSQGMPPSIGTTSQIESP